MKKVLLGVFAALALACSSSGGGGATGDSGHPADGGGDTIVPGDGSGTDTHTGDTHHVDVVPGDTPSEGGAGENTVGKPCTAATEAADCDPLGTMDNYCRLDEPDPVCWGNSCDPGDGTKIVACDNADGTDRGVCYPITGGTVPGVCLPACSFDDTGAAPVGCTGKDACNPFGWTVAAPITGVGYCFGGCFADADCKGTGFTKCQTEEGLCTKSFITYVKKPGDACTFKTASGSTQDCNCFAASATDKGYCTQFCEVGDTAHACPGSLKCTAVLPTHCASGSALFTKSPSGLQGECLLPCTGDADCKDSTGASISSTCQATPDGKFCMPFTSDPSSGC